MSEKKLERMLDKDGNPVTLMGHPVYINHEMEPLPEISMRRIYPADYYETDQQAIEHLRSIMRER